MPAGIYRGRVLLTIHYLPVVRALLECGYYSREGLIWGNTVDAPNTEEGSSDTQTDENEVKE